MTVFEEIERRQKVLSLLFKVFFVALLLAVLAIVGWVIAYFNHSENAAGAVSYISASIEGLRHLA